MFLILLLLPLNLFAAGWYCQDVASEWIESRTLSACGIGQGKSESEARQDAYQKAKDEVNNVCNPNSVCGTRVINIDPKRTECSHNKTGYTCHRLFHYYVTDQERAVDAVKVQPVQQRPISYRANVNNYNYNYNTMQNYYPKKMVNQVISEIQLDMLREEMEIDAELDRMMDEI